MNEEGQYERMMAWIAGRIAEMEAFERHEMAVAHVPDRWAAAAWVLRALANGTDPETAWVFGQIEQRRVGARLGHPRSLRPQTRVTQTEQIEDEAEYQREGAA